MQKVSTLRRHGLGRVAATGGASVSITLTTGIIGVSVYARTSDAYIKIADGAAVADATGHFIAAGERCDLDVSCFSNPVFAHINGPSAATSNLQITEIDP